MLRRVAIQGRTWRLRIVSTFMAACAMASCSSLNREGPPVTCADLNGGAVNACQQGIIASCKDGKTVTYQVCTDGTNPDQVCGDTWQVKGRYQCTQSSTGNATCIPAASSLCGSCLQSTCPPGYDQCVNDPTCSATCSGPLAAAIATCVQQCKSGSSPSCTSADFASSGSGAGSSSGSGSSGSSSGGSRSSSSGSAACSGGYYVDGVSPQQSGPLAGTNTSCGTGAGQCPCQGSTGDLFCGQCGRQCSYCPSGSYCPTSANICSSTTCGQGTAECPQSAPISCAGGSLCCPSGYPVCCLGGAANTCATAQSACPGSGGNACKGM